MSLTPGTQLGVHEIIEPIGSGGMGEVYRARDTRLGRDVAIKVSAAQFSERFSREARAIAALNHPNICTLYDIGPNYLVMELVDGETLRGPLPLETAIAYARQIADGLEAAHEKGIIHRDLKPTNIKVSSSGVVKILDFGLAKEIFDGSQSDRAPTTISSMTGPGVILGTTAYMSPEQAKAKAADKRADIWAFGVVFYEMLTGQQLFKGETAQEVLAAVLKEEPDLSVIPAEVRPLLRRCLVKNPQRRLRDIGDAMPLLEDVSQLDKPQRNLTWFWPAVTILLAAVVGLAFWAPWRRPIPPEVTRFTIEPSEGTNLGLYVDLSPDGRKLVFTAEGDDGRTRLWIRDMDNVSSRKLSGTEIASGWGSPFWSHDSRYVAFSDGNVLKKVDASGTSPPVTIATVPVDVGRGSWSPEGIIIFGARGGTSPIWRVSDAGGDAMPITQPKNSELDGFPFFLPDGRHFLFTRNSAQSQSLYVGSLDHQPQDQLPELLMQSPAQAVYVPSTKSGAGYIVYLRGNTLNARAFDPTRRVFTGDAVPIVEGIGVTGTPGYAFFSASSSGALAYRSAGGNQLTLFDRRGNPIRRVGEPGIVSALRLSPDGGTLAMERDSDIWLRDLTREDLRRLTSDAAKNGLPLWSPDGTRVVFGSNRNGGTDFVVKSADGTGAEQSIHHSDKEKWLDDWSHNGRYLVYNEYAPNGNEDEVLLPLDGDRQPIPLLHSPFKEYWAQFSPDDRWIAYESDESGRFEVYVRPFSPDSPSRVGAAYQISKDGGERPLWRKDGKELVYVASSKLTAVDVVSNPQFQAGPPKALFQLPASIFYRDFAMSPDGQTFLIPAPFVESSRRITVVMNWQSGLKR